MAESKRADPEEKYDLPVPPFDAPAYVRKEVIGARATIVLALFGVILGQLGAIVAFQLKNPVASVAILLFGLTAVKGVLEVCGVNAADWDKKQWAGHLAVLIFTWLAVWVLVQNPPFMV